MTELALLNQSVGDTNKLTKKDKKKPDDGKVPTVEEVE